MEEAWFLVFTSWKKTYYPEILGPEHKKLLYEARPDSFKEYISDNQARYLVEVTEYKRKDSATYNIWHYRSHGQYYKLDSVPDEALSEPRKNYIKSEILFGAHFEGIAMESSPLRQRSWHKVRWIGFYDRPNTRRSWTERGGVWNRGAFDSSP